MKFKRIIAAVMAATCVFSLASCNKKEEEPPLELIDFENSKLNVDNSEIEKYVKSKGYENIAFTFDVDKQIYSCEVTLSEEESKKIEIDGEGYESFVSEARSFLIGGTKVMKTVLEDHGLSGISSGMVLLSNEDAVYCVAVDGSVTYVAHVQKETASVEDVKDGIKEKAEAMLETEVTVRINTIECFVGIEYKGTQTQETVDTCFNEIKVYLKEIGLGNYELTISGMDGQPLAYDESEPAEEPLPKVPETVSYNHVGYIGAGNAPVFEIISTEGEHKNEGDLAVITLAREFGDSSFFFYIVDENEKFLGKGSENEYTPYVFSTLESEKDTSSCEIPFKYYLSKYFNGIEYDGYSSRSYKNREYGYKQYEFIINEVSKDSREQATKAVESIFNALKATIGNEQATVTIIAYPGTEYEIKMRSYDPDIDGESSGDNTAESAENASTEEN